jgi:hypothetical protein
MSEKSHSRYVEHPKLRSMRVRCWFNAVSQVSGLTTGQLEREFGEKGTERAPRSCIWNKYRRGDVVPRSRRPGDRSKKLVERVESRYPGTAKWLTSPLWRLADPALMEMSEIRQIYEGMPKSIRSIFVEPGSKATSIFWRRSVDPKRACEVLLRFRDVDALIALLAMVKEAEVVQDRAQYGVAVKAVLQELWLSVDRHFNYTHVDIELTRFLQARWKQVEN